MRTNEKVTIIQEMTDVNVRVNYFWHTDEKLINWNDNVDFPVGWLHANVVIDKLEFTEEFEGLGKTVNFEVYRLHINDTFIGELIEAGDKEAESGTIFMFSVVVGHG